MPSGADLGMFAQFGVVGVIAVMGIIFAKGAYAREKERADSTLAENRRLYELMIERVLPALSSAARAAEDSGELLRSMQREREVTQIAQQRSAIEQLDQLVRVNLNRDPTGVTHGPASP